MLALVALIFQSCSTDKAADAADILSTIPSDVSLVAVINTQSILEKTGCKIDGEKITPGPELNNAIAGIKDIELRNILTAIANGESGIDPSVLVVFREGYNTYLTGNVANTAKLKKFIEDNTKQKFNSSNGIDFASNTAISGSRFWMNLEKNYIDESDIRHFNTIDESQSFMQNAYASNLASVKADVEGWANIMGIANTGKFDFQQKATFQMAIQMLFDNPSAITFSVNSSKGLIETRASVVDSKGKTSKFLLPSDKVDVNTIASIGGTADIVAALSIPGKLIETLEKETNSKAPSMFAIYLRQFKGVDGTAAFASTGENVKGVITTDGKDMSSLSSFISSMSDVKTSVNGNLLEFSKGQISGSENVASVADNFKGAIGGITMGKSQVDSEFSKAFQFVSLMLMPEGNGLVIKASLKGLNKDVNPIISLLSL